MAARLEDRIRAERDRQFVGRVEELRIFEDLLSDAQSTHIVLHIHGPGGVGKTTLLRQFVGLCGKAGVVSHTIDARNLQPTPVSFQNGLLIATQSETVEAALEKLTQTPKNVLFVDTFEAIQPLDGWIRDRFIPQLPENTLVVILGRKRPSSGWRSFGWQSLARAVPLRNLGDQDSYKYLSAQDVPVENHSEIVRLTHGFPLALCLVADTFTHHGRLQLAGLASPDVLGVLLDRFLEGVTSSEHRDLLDLCVLVRTTTEALIASVFGSENSRDLFEWLRGLSFVEETSSGLMPHDLARDTIAAEIRWRNPDHFSELHHKARSYYADRLDRASGPTQQAILFDYIYLHRDSPMMQPFFDWNSSPNAFVDSARPEDEEQIVSLVTSNEGPDSGRIARYWFHKQPGSFLVVRDSHSESGIVGLLGKVRLDLVEPNDHTDPAISSALATQDFARLRPGDVGIHFRFWMAAEGYQSVGATQSLLFIAIVQHNFAVPSLGITILSFAQPDFWAPMFDYALHRRVTDADFSVGGISYGVFAMDWRAIPPKKWLDLLSEQEAPIKQKAVGPRRANELLVLSKESFDRSVHDVLKSFSNLNRLSESPLLESRLIVDRIAGSADSRTKIEALRSVIIESAKSLNSSSKDAKLFQALDLGFLRPKKSQEHAAELLDISIASFRRHLKQGTERLTGILWQLETGA